MTPRHLAAEPITDGDAAIERALATAELLPLVASAVHITGDRSLLRDLPAPGRFTFDDLTGGLSPPDQDMVRRVVLPVVLRAERS